METDTTKDMDMGICQETGMDASAMELLTKTDRDMERKLNKFPKTSDGTVTLLDGTGSYGSAYLFWAGDGCGTEYGVGSGTGNEYCKGQLDGSGWGVEEK